MHLPAVDPVAGEDQRQPVQCRQVQVPADAADTHVRRGDQAGIPRAASGGGIHNPQARAACHLENEEVLDEASAGSLQVLADRVRIVRSLLRDDRAVRRAGAHRPRGDDDAGRDVANSHFRSHQSALGSGQRAGRPSGSVHPEGQRPRGCSEDQHTDDDTGHVAGRYRHPPGLGPSLAGLADPLRAGCTAWLLDRTHRHHYQDGSRAQAA